MNNGCGWKWWVNFSDIIEANLNSFKNFDRNKVSALESILNPLCHEHDLDYFFKKWFTSSNFVFAFIFLEHKELDKALGENWLF